MSHDQFYHAPERRQGARRRQADRRSAAHDAFHEGLGEVPEERRLAQRRQCPDRRQAAAKVLSSQELLRLGALTLADERSAGLEQLITAQQAVYTDPATSRDELVKTLLDRDRQLAQMGRQIADGRTASRMLREFVRGLLATADMRTLRRVGDATKGGTIEGILEAMGAEPADLRQLARNGSTLGELEDQGDRAAALADGRRKS